MNETLFILAGRPIVAWQGLTALALFTFLLLLALAVLLLRAVRRHAAEAAVAAARQREIDEKLASFQRLNAELSGRLQTMAEVLGSRQADFARFVSERLDAVGHRVGQGLESSAKATVENLSKLNERLAVIDAAQARLAGITEEVRSFKDILTNKQARGAFGQGRMEAIVRDGLPQGAYVFQGSLSNGTRPDCLIRLPGDNRPLVIDAKFPLEAFTLLKAAASDEERRQAGQRVRTDFGKHVKDIAERYLIAGETQDVAILFVPSESVYADLNEHFEEIVQRALRQRVIIVSPTLLMMAIQVMQTIVRDARMREAADVIQNEVRKLLDDVGRLRDRVGKLDNHFRQAQDDVAGILTSTAKIAKRGEKIDALEFSDEPAMPPVPMRAAE